MLSEAPDALSEYDSVHVFRGKPTQLPSEIVDTAANRCPPIDREMWLGVVYDDIVMAALELEELELYFSYYFQAR